MIDLTGTWASEVLDPYGPTKHTGQLNITRTGNLFLSTSAPGWDTWHGYLDGNILQAVYKKDGTSGTITAHVSENGTVLQGTWISWKDGLQQSGAYLARRLVSTENGRVS